METDIPFRNIFCFDHRWETPCEDGLIYGYHCVTCRNGSQSDAGYKVSANSDVVASELIDAYSKRVTSIARSAVANEIGDSLFSAHGIGIRSIEDGKTTSPPAPFDGPVRLLESAATLGTAPENPFGHPAPVAQRHDSRARSSNDDGNRQRSLLQA
ncbi:hypothetical protein [Ensifer sp. 4252]|uniref:hypothetical protein n=1 Tax=Ensifer sp. 4252 TaxID=3373915 RepID=UPI003D1A9498